MPDLGTSDRPVTVQAVVNHADLVTEGCEQKPYANAGYVAPTTPSAGTPGGAAPQQPAQGSPGEKTGSERPREGARPQPGGRPGSDAPTSAPKPRVPLPSSPQLPAPQPVTVGGLTQTPTAAETSGSAVEAFSASPVSSVRPRSAQAPPVPVGPVGRGPAPLAAERPIAMPKAAGVEAAENDIPAAVIALGALLLV